MKNKQEINKTTNIKTYKSVDEALEAKHAAAKKFITKIGVEKIAALNK
jgi:hypothetical protein